MSEAKQSAKEHSFEQLANMFNATLNRTGMIRPEDNKEVQKLDKKDLPAKAMLNLDKVGALMVHNGDRTSTLIKLDGVEQYDQAGLNRGLKEMEPLLMNNRTKMQVESVVASLHRNATIETNESTPIAGEEYSE